LIGAAPQHLNPEGIPQAWLHTEQPDSIPNALYRPAVLIECSVNFRSLRAGLNHSEEQSYTAWLPSGELAIDWDSPAVETGDLLRIAQSPDDSIGYVDGDYQFRLSAFEQYQAELIDKLVRHQRLKVFLNPVFGLFSSPGDAIEDFLSRIAESALARVEPELKKLRGRFELQLEQVREAQALRGARAEGITAEAFISRKLHFFASENRLADMFSTLAGSVFGSTESKLEEENYKPDEAELREDLERIEQEASEALRSLYDEYLKLANEYDVFEIGLQPNNIQVLRRVLLWVPTPAGK
jgi:hypothetical protein